MKRWAGLLFLLSACALRDPVPEMRPMALERIGPAEVAKRARLAKAVVVARVEEIEEAIEYVPPCGILARITHNCPALTYRMKLRAGNDKVTWALFQVPWDGYQPLRIGMYATFFLHERWFEACVLAGPYTQCRMDRWLALNGPEDVVAVLTQGVEEHTKGDQPQPKQ